MCDVESRKTKYAKYAAGPIRSNQRVRKTRQESLVRERAMFETSSDARGRCVPKLWLVDLKAKQIERSDLSGREVKLVQCAVWNVQWSETGSRKKGERLVKSDG